MATAMKEWVEDEVAEMRDKSLTWLSHRHFFRDPPRPLYSEPSLFFSPADGILLYQKVVSPEEAIVDIKGKPYSLRDALRDPHFEAESLVVGIFMTFFDVHINRVPYPGRLTYRFLDPLDTFNHPMLEVEKSLLEDLRVSTESARYLHKNQRVVNRVISPELEHPYWVLQVADYDVDCITPFRLRQNQPFAQGERFSMIRFGSQVDLVIPLARSYELETLQETGAHVEAGLDPLVRIQKEEPWSRP